MSILYTKSMDITNWDNDEIIHLVMAKGHINQKILLNMIKLNTDEEIPQSTFSSKIKRNALKVCELQKICNLLGYSIHIKKNDKKSL